MIGRLPQSVTVNGNEYAVRTDYRDILTILEAYNDPNLEDREKVYVCLVIFYEDFIDVMPPDDYESALIEAMRFIDMGNEESQSKRHPKTMDWEQDESILFPAINKVAGREVRAMDYLHWWTFIGYFMEISDGVFSQVMSLRMKKARGKKLEKYEREFWNTNKSMCVLRKKISEQQKDEMDMLRAMFQ